jgi:peptide deformylase
MAFLPIYSCFHPIMKKNTEPITEINGDILKLAQDMLETMHTADGCGLAGNQVGIMKSIVVIDTSAFDNTKTKYKNIVLINPVILSSSEEEFDYKEGCLSIPDIHEVVKRPKAIQVKFYDISGKEHIIEDNDILARVAQHEIDHLNGILFYEKLTPMRRTLIKSKLRKIQKGQLLPDYKFVDQFDNIL